MHGHRGARALRPENTLPAFEYAIEQGVDVLELDMAITKDDVVVVSHDPILEPPVCTGPAAKDSDPYTHVGRDPAMGLRRHTESRVSPPETREGHNDADP